MPEQSEGNNHTSKINVLLVPHTIVFLLAGHKVDFLTRAEQENPFSEPLKEKENRVRDGKNINFIRVVVTLALFGHQTLHSQNKLFFP